MIAWAILFPFVNGLCHNIAKKSLSRYHKCLRQKIRWCLNLKERGSVSRSTVKNQDAIWLYLRVPTAKLLRVADPRSLPCVEIETLHVSPVSFWMRPQALFETHGRDARATTDG